MVGKSGYLLQNKMALNISSDKKTVIIDSTIGGYKVYSIAYHYLNHIGKHSDGGNITVFYKNKKLIITGKTYPGLRRVKITLTKKQALEFAKVHMKKN